MCSDVITRFVISGLFSIHFTIVELENIFQYTEVFFSYIGLIRGPRLTTLKSDDLKQFVGRNDV